MIGTQSQEQNAPRRRLTTRQTKLLVGGIVVAAVVGYLIFSAASGSAAYYLTIEELGQQGATRRDVRVVGVIVEESIVWEPRDMLLEFEITDDGGRLPVSYHGSRPDMLRDGAELVVEGRYAPEGVFEARTLMLKCPSKYEEAE